MELTPDSEARGWIAWLPRAAQPYAALMRLDRPVGTWLLFWPCAFAVALAGVQGRWALFGWLLLGAFTMRSAGCVYNDIVDRELDASVARTRHRPIASGRVSVRQGWALALMLCLVGLVVLLQLERLAQGIALASLALVAAYPFMKRITGWPQAWLGMVFAWGALVGWPAVTGGFDLAALWLWLGAAAWTLGYDTIYAVQDLEDDALAGIRSSARTLGLRLRLGVGLAYAAALLFFALAIWRVLPVPLALAALLPGAGHLLSQALRVDAADPAGALRLFRSNRDAGLLFALGFLTVGLAARGGGF